MQWLLANLFLLALALIAAGLFFLTLWTVRLFGLSPEAERYVMLFAAVLDLYLTYLIARRLHGFIDRKLYARARK